MAVRFQLRRDTAANWASANSVLALGEPGVETDTLKVKVGDGATVWNSLAYSISNDFADITNPPTTLAGYGITDALSLANLSVGAEATAAGDGAIAYNNATGVFTYTPPDTSTFLTTVAYADLTSKPTTLSGYGITDAATTAQGALADSAVQPGNNIETSIIDSADSSAITITPDVVMSAGLTVGNHIIPSSNENIDLGSNTNRFRELFLSGNTISLDNLKLSCVPATGTLQIHDGSGTLKNIQSHNINANDVTVNNITTAGYLRGPASFVIDPAAFGDDTGTVVIAGNLQVDGVQTTINSTTVSIDDLNFSIATDAADSAAANGAGITVGGAGATLNYTHATTSWDMNKPLNVTGDIGVSGTVDGVDIAARDAILTSTTTTAGAALPKAGGTMTGNVGIGVTPNAGWSANNKVLDFGYHGSVSTDADGSKFGMNMAMNAYAVGGADPSSWKYKTNSAYHASLYHQTAGSHNFYVTNNTAITDSAISWNAALTIDNTGNVGIGTAPSQIFHVQKAADDKLVYGSNPRLLLDTPTGINGLRVLGDTTPFEFKIDSGTYNGSAFQMGGTGDLSFIGTTTTASDTFNDSPTFFFNSQRWNGSANSTHFQGAIKGHTRSATNGDGYLGIGATASANQLNIDASSGNVGIGTTTPGSELSVVNTGDVKVEIKSTGTGDADAILMLDSADTGESEIRFKHDGVLGAKIQWYTDGSPDLNIMTETGTDGVIDFQPNNSLAMRIQPGGTIVTRNHAVFSAALSSGANTVKITTPQTLSAGNHWDQFTAIFTMTGVDGGLSGNTFTQWRQTWTGLNTWGGGSPTAIIGSAPSVTHATVSADYVQFDIATSYIPGNTMLRVEVLSHAMRTDCTVTIT